MPFTRWLVPPPVRVSSRRSTLSHAKLLNTLGRIVLGRIADSLIAATIFYKHRAVSFSSNWEYDTHVQDGLRSR